MQRQEKIELLKSLIRIDSDDGNELAVAELLATVLINIGRNPMTLVMGWIGFYLRPLGRFFISLYF